MHPTFGIGANKGYQILQLFMQPPSLLNMEAIREAVQEHVARFTV